MYAHFVNIHLFCLEMLLVFYSEWKVLYQEQHCRQRCLSADVNHGKDWRPVALPGSHKQHPATQTERLTIRLLAAILG